MKKHSICTILWNDASYSFEKELPKNLPDPRLTVGLIISNNDECVFIATNVSYDQKTGDIAPVDGFVIPKGTIIEMKEITKSL